MAVQDRTTFRAFFTVAPDKQYSKDPKQTIKYSALEKYTVILALNKEVTEAWQTSTSMAY